MSGFKNAMLSVFLVFGALSISLGSMAVGAQGNDDENEDDHGSHKARTLYIWAGDQARMAPDFLAVIDFDERLGRLRQGASRRCRSRRPATSATSRTIATSRPTRRSSPAAGC